MIATAALTFEEFEQLPDEPGKQELLNGELIALPPANDRHMRIAQRLLLYLLARLDGGPLAARMETGYRLGGATWVVPDVSVPHPGQSTAQYLEGAPLLAVEIISPANRALNVERKLRLYFEHGAMEVWVIYPESGIVEVHDARGSLKLVTKFQSVALPGAEVDPSQFL